MSPSKSNNSIDNPESSISAKNVSKDEAILISSDSEDDTKVTTTFKIKSKQSSLLKTRRSLFDQLNKEINPNDKNDLQASSIELNKDKSLEDITKVTEGAKKDKQ